jgi:hypothetical protein
LTDNVVCVAELSLTVPIVNTVAFLFTVIGEWWVEGKVISRGMSPVLLARSVADSPRYHGRDGAVCWRDCPVCAQQECQLGVGLSCMCRESQFYDRFSLSLYGTNQAFCLFDPVQTLTVKLLSPRTVENIHFIRYHSPSPAPGSSTSQCPFTATMPHIATPKQQAPLCTNESVPDAPPMNHIQKLPVKSSPCHLRCFPVAPQ